MKMKSILTIIFLSAFCLPVFAESQLEGTFTFAGPVNSKGSLTKGKSHIHFKITGDSAKAMYESFEEEPYKDECVGLMFKGKANVGCYEIAAGKTYICGFSVNLNKNRTEAGQVGAC